MHIGIDGYEVNQERLVGVGRFAYEILHQLYLHDKRNIYTVFLPNNPLSHMPKEHEGWRYTVIPSKGFWVFTSLPYGILTSSKKIDVFYTPTHYIPHFVKIPRIVSIMDLSYLHFPDMFRKTDYYKLKNWTSYSIKHAKKVITISEFSKEEICTTYHISKDSIAVAYPGINTSYSLIKSEISHEKPEFKYILFVGTIQPRKNIQRLIEAYSYLEKKWKKDKIHLVIIGKKGWLYDQIFLQVQKLQLEQYVHFFDYVSDDDKISLFKNATCFVLPSLYEGFGIPVIEAMMYGVPTVISNVSSLPEIGGNASIYIDPYNTQSIADGIEKAISLSASEKEKLIHKGKENVTRFSWIKSGEIVLQTIQDAGKVTNV